MVNDPLGSFPASQWSQIDRARGDRSSLRREALGSLVTCYLPPLRAHLVLRMRIDRPRAEDLLHDFVQDRVLEHYFLAHAKQTKGRFRSFLLRSLENYVIDCLRREAKHAGHDMGAKDSQCAHLAVVDVPADEFDVIWARNVLNQALERMRAECLAADRLPIWQVFECRVLRPTLLGTPPPSYDQFSRQFGFATPDQASNSLMMAKRHFGRVLRSVVGEYVADDEMDEELGDLRACLARLGPLGVEIPRDVPGGQEDVASSILNEPGSADQTLGSDLDPIAQMLRLNAERDALWDSDDLAELLRAQLGAPLAELLPDLKEPLATDLRPTDDPTNRSPTTLAELFQHPRPPLPVLEVVKCKAREGTRDENSVLPSDVWSVIYFASIAAALAHGNSRISKSNDETLAYGFQRVIEFTWLTESLRSVIGAAVLRIVVPVPE